MPTSTEKPVKLKVSINTFLMLETPHGESGLIVPAEHNPPQYRLLQK